jgi:hypothetical protein
MNRTVWLAAACLVLLGAMAAAKVAKVPAAETPGAKPIARATVDADLTREPLIKADRLEVTYARQEEPSQSALQSIDPIAPEVKKTISPAETNIVSRHWHDPNAISSSVPNSKRTAKKRKPAADSRDSHALDGSKPSEQTRRCDHTAAFSGLLRSLNLAAACDS